MIQVDNVGLGILHFLLLITEMISMSIGMLNSVLSCGTKYIYLSFTDLGMEQYDLQGQRRDMKHKGRNVVWSIAMDKCLIEALAVQARNGNKIDKCFNENAYTAACIAVNSRFNLNLNNQKVINRLKTIKKRYKAMKDMLSQEGFKWNPNTKMIECDSDDLWKRYVAVSLPPSPPLPFFCLFKMCHTVVYNIPVGVHGFIGVGTP